MYIKENSDWLPFFNSEFKQPYFKELKSFIESEYNTAQCYPNFDEIFNAFNITSFKNTRVVIIGQDPYHGEGQANGLCFSVNKGIKIPPSLKNIFKELEIDLNIPYPESGDLTFWAKQGVLLLNATLTVKKGKAGSHQKKGWETFTDNAISYINSHKKGVVFLLWGGYAKKKMKLLNPEKHFILTSGHPSPLSANKGHWFGNKCFSKTNLILKQAGSQEICWTLPYSALRLL